MKKNNDFFTPDENGYVSDTPDTPKPLVNGSVAEATESSGRLKKQIAIVVLIAVLLSAALLTLRFLYHNVIEQGAQYYPDSWVNSGSNREPFLKFYEPDWETDILSDPEYLAMKGEIMYAPSDSQSIAVPEGQYLSYGGKGLNFMAEYVNTVISGDHEKLNSMFTESYFENNEAYEDFPQQKIFDIKIKKYPYNDQAYDSTSIEDEYYIITYKIYHNDGLFRDDIDEESELAQLFELLIYSDGSVRIDNVIDLPGYFN